MLKAFESNLMDNGLVKKGERIILGVSGGPDSMAMLDLFLKIRKKWRLSLFVVHINHQFRGEDAIHDAKSVESFCNENEVAFYGYSYPVLQLSKDWGMSFEEAGRKLRYDAFEEVRAQVDGHRIAVAQNKNDQAETILMRMMRGAGMDGLSGIPLKRGEYIVRPVLFMSRREIELHCEKFNLPVCHDYTNDETIYTRNKIRHVIIPYMEDHFNANLVEGLYNMGQRLSSDADFIESSLDDVLKQSGIAIENAKSMKLDWVLDLHKALQVRLVRRILAQCGEGLKDVSSKQVESVIDLIQQRKHGKHQVVSGVRFEVQYDQMFYEKLADHSEKVLPKWSDASYLCKEMRMEAFNGYTLHDNEVAMDLDKIKGSLFVRSRVEGDTFQPFGMQGTKKLKKFLIDLKIPAGKRDEIPLLCDSDGIVWVVGLRLSERVKVDDKTRRVGIFKWSDCC